MKTNNAVNVPAITCPACGYVPREIAAVTPKAEARMPETGDISVCYNCTEVLVFDSPKTVRKATIADLMKLTDVDRQIIGVTQTHIMLWKSQNEKKSGGKDR